MRGDRAENRREPVHQKLEEEKKNRKHTRIDPVLSSKWPLRLISLLHSVGVGKDFPDRDAARLLNLSETLIDFKIGVQGVEDSFAFSLHPQ